MPKGSLRQKVDSLPAMVGNVYNASSASQLLAENLLIDEVVLDQQDVVVSSDFGVSRRRVVSVGRQKIWG